MKPITTKELQMLTYIQSFALQNNYLPTVREICNGMGFKSTSTVHYRIKRLEDLGYIERINSDYAKSGLSGRYIVKGLKYVKG